MLKEVTNLPSGIQVLEAVGTVTAADYERVFVPLVERARRAGARMRLVYEFGPGFERITAGALWADARLGSRYLRLLDGCAVVSDIGWIRATSRAIGAWMPCPLRVYDHDKRDDAVVWLASLPESADVSRRAMARAYIGGIGAGLVSLVAFAAPFRERAAIAINRRKLRSKYTFGAKAGACRSKSPAPAGRRRRE